MPLGKWVGGFPIERTYTEWSTSRYADRPGNRYFDPAFKRDCQTCHMQQDYGQPGTAQTLYHDGQPTPPLVGSRLDRQSGRAPTSSHHFVGGNAYIPGMIGASLDEVGTRRAVSRAVDLQLLLEPIRSSPYHNAYWMNVGERGAADAAGASRLGSAAPTCSDLDLGA